MFKACDGCGGFAPFTMEVEVEETYDRDGWQGEIQVCAYCKADIELGEVDGVQAK